MANYSKKAQRTIGKAVRRMKRGTLKTGSGDTVTDKKQAVAIGISEAREKGLKVPNQKKKVAKKATTKKKKTAKKTAPKKKTPAKKKTAKKSTVKKSAAKKKR